VGVFKAYDIRGIYNKDWNKETAYAVGFFLPELLKTDKILVGHDARTSSDEIFHYLSEGITDAGADVWSIGYATTPMVYFSTSYYNFKGSVQITASHNPPEYNGLKISRENSLPVGYESGLKELEHLVFNEKIDIKKDKGRVYSLEAKQDYLNFLKKYREDYSDLSVSMDCSNGMAAILVKDLFGGSIHYLYDELDGTFPNHEPNPLEEENVRDLKKAVLQNKSDIGIIYDGDADRVMFVDEKGKFIQPDLIIGLMTGYFFSPEYKGELTTKNILCDIRTSKSTTDYIKNLGGIPNLWKVGHAYAKVKLREIDAVFGGELAGHYYFKDFYFCDSGILTSIIVLNVLNNLKKKGSTFSTEIAKIKKYANSGEMNFRIENKAEAMNELRDHFVSAEKPLVFLDFDGYRIEYKDWWFNVRPSNTEPYLRLIIEASDERLLKEKTNIIKNLLKKYQ